MTRGHVWRGACGWMGVCMVGVCMTGGLHG